MDEIIRPVANEIRVQIDADQVVYSYEPDEEKQRGEVKKFWDAHHERRVEFEAYKRRERIRRALLVIKPAAWIAGVVLAGAAIGLAVVYAFVR